jgi:hypothetical protein
MSNGGVNLALFFPGHPILYFGQDLLQKHHGVLLHAFNYMRVDIHCKGNAGLCQKSKQVGDKYLNIKKGVCPLDWPMDSL